MQVDLPISQAGAYVYWIEYDGPGKERIKGRAGYFNIDPALKIKARTPILDDKLHVLPPGTGAALKDDLVDLPLDGLALLTVVSKWMGPLDHWRKHFAEAKERGYTMLHYTPLQERGESDSPYSIRDQFRYDPNLFATKNPANGGRDEIEAILKVAREEYGLLSLTDVVLNHTSNDTPWLVEHPEAGTSISYSRRDRSLTSSQATVQPIRLTSLQPLKSTPHSLSCLVSLARRGCQRQSTLRRMLLRSLVQLKRSSRISNSGSIIFLIPQRKRSH